MTFYENLRVIREDRGYTQQQIAEVIGTTRSEERRVGKECL